MTYVNFHNVPVEDNFTCRGKGIMIRYNIDLFSGLVANVFVDYQPFMTFLLGEGAYTQTISELVKDQLDPYLDGRFRKSLVFRNGRAVACKHVLDGEPSVAHVLGPGGDDALEELGYELGPDGIFWFPKNE
jgi:hypothetical protein